MAAGSRNAPGNIVSGQTMTSGGGVATAAWRVSATKRSKSASRCSKVHSSLLSCGRLVWTTPMRNDSPVGSGGARGGLRATKTTAAIATVDGASQRRGRVQTISAMAALGTEASNETPYVPTIAAGRESIGEAMSGCASKYQG